MRVLRDVGLITAVAGYLLFAWVTLDRRGDEQRIASLVTDTVNAVNERDLGGVVRYVSTNYRGDDGLNRERLRMLIAQAMRSEIDFHASALIEDIVVHGDRAALRVHARVDGDQERVIYDRVLTLQLRKEPSRHALVFPTRAWRIVNVSNLGINQVL